MPRLPFLHRSRRPGRPPAAVPLVLLAAVPAALLSGCLGAGLDPAHRPEPRPALDAYRLERAEARSLAGCRYDYRVFEPAGGAPATSVILGHGFLRDQDRQVGLARALANAGHRAVTLDFCNMRPWNGHHERNAADMRRLARTYGLPGRTVYAGFSAGALAALLAGADDPDALGVVALDLVDQGGLGLAAASRSPVPIVGLAGPPAACNANGSGLAAFAARPGVDDAPSSAVRTGRRRTGRPWDRPCGRWTRCRAPRTATSSPRRTGSASSPAGRRRRSGPEPGPPGPLPDRAASSSYGVPSRSSTSSPRRPRSADPGGPRRESIRPVTGERRHRSRAATSWALPEGVPVATFPVGVPSSGAPSRLRGPQTTETRPLP